VRRLRRFLSQQYHYRRVLRHGQRQQRRIAAVFAPLFGAKNHEKKKVFAV
jgi:hypothetical protein